MVNNDVCLSLNDLGHIRLNLYMSFFDDKNNKIVSIGNAIAEKFSNNSIEIKECHYGDQARAYFIVPKDELWVASSLMKTAIQNWFIEHKQEVLEFFKRIFREQNWEEKCEYAINNIELLYKERYIPIYDDNGITYKYMEIDMEF